MGQHANVWRVALCLMLWTATLGLHAAKAAINCTDVFGDSPLHFLFFADPGDFTGSAENKYFLDNMQSLQNVTAFSNLCGHSYVGTLMGQRTAIITTGIGPTTAGLCTWEVLSCADLIKDIIYMGTSGFPAAVGGILNPPLNANDTSGTCTAANNKTGKGQVIRVGDICVSPVSINAMCTLASWTEQCTGFPNVCSAPRIDAGPDADYLYGKCLFTSPPPGSLTLSDEILAVSQSQQFANNLVTPNSAVQAYDRTYWGMMSNGTGLSYHQYSSSEPPTVFNYTTCAEVDGQFFFSGVPWEFGSRIYSAMAINKAFGTNQTAQGVVYMNAMEAVGFEQAMESYNAVTTSPVTYTVVRANSDWTHGPVVYKGNGYWANDPYFVSDFNDGYAYAIASYSNLVLSVFQKRCAALYPNDNSMCKYTVSYS